MTKMTGTRRRCMRLFVLLAGTGAATGGKVWLTVEAVD
jgi:hypothetical protein